MKNFWNKINGWKTIIGLTCHSALLAANIAFGFASFNQELIGHSLIFQITGVGLGHKAQKLIKSETGKKAFNIIAKLLKIK